MPVMVSNQQDNSLGSMHAEARVIIMFCSRRNNYYWRDWSPWRQANYYSKPEKQKQDAKQKAKKAKKKKMRNYYSTTTTVLLL